MRSVLGVLSLLVTLVIVGMVVKKQLVAMPASPLAIPTPAASQPDQQQFKQALDQAMQSARPVADEK